MDIRNRRTWVLFPFFARTLNFSMCISTIFVNWIYSPDWTLQRIRLFGVANSTNQGNEWTIIFATFIISVANDFQSKEISFLFPFYLVDPMNTRFALPIALRFIIQNKKSMHTGEKTAHRKYLSHKEVPWRNIYINHQSGKSFLNCNYIRIKNHIL